jgi:S1-C subfamily serine protease
VKRPYLAVLAAVATLILAGGLLLRQRLAAHEPAAAPPSQASAMQLLSREAQMRREASFVADRVADVARLVEFVPSTGAAGVRWAPDTVVTTSRSHAVRALVRPNRTAADSAGGAPLRRMAALSPDTARRDWLLVVGRDAAGHVLSAVALAGGRTTVDCADGPVEAFVTGGPLDASLAGAGVFDLDGEVRGVVAWCGDRLLAVPVSEVVRLLAADAGAPTRLGLEVAPADSLARAYARAYVGGDTGLLVTAVVPAGPADRAGLRVGDVIVAVGGEPAVAASAAALRAGDPAGLALTRQRGRARAALRLAPTPADADTGATLGVDPLGIDLTPPPAPRGVAVREVRLGSAAAAAGLRAGDRLLRVGDVAVATAAQAARLLGAAGARPGAPTLLVVERGGVERGVLVAGAAPDAGPAGGLRP